MESILFSALPDGVEAAEGRHAPCLLVKESGVYVAAAGSARLSAGQYALRAPAGYVWLAVEDGEASLDWQHAVLHLTADAVCFLPPGQGALLDVSAHARCLWIAFAGERAPLLVSELGGLPGRPILQRATLRQLCLAKQIAGVAASGSAADAVSYQLQQLLYGMLAGRWGHSAGLGEPLSREVRRVLDALLDGALRGELSLAEMAAVARMPAETFRKRFVSEMGLPPLRYALYLKMERAKSLLAAPGGTVSDAAAALGFHDPYRFSKQFKSVVGMPPSEFSKLAEAARRASGSEGLTPPRPNFDRRA